MVGRQVGSHVLTELLKHRHQVTALVRDDAHTDAVAARGATPAVADLYDRPAVAGVFSIADGAIHTASPGDATSRTWQMPSGASWRTIRPVATTSLATDRTRPLPN